MDTCNNQNQCKKDANELVEKSIGRLWNEPITVEPSSVLAREIKIKQLNHGYVVNIGCQTFAIESVGKLVSNLEKYLNSPIETETEWLSGNLLK